jgi:hypothetical protein
VTSGLAAATIFLCPWGELPERDGGHVIAFADLYLPSWVLRYQRTCGCFQLATHKLSSLWHVWIFPFLGSQYSLVDCVCVCVCVCAVHDFYGMAGSVKMEQYLYRDSWYDASSSIYTLLALRRRLHILYQYLCRILLINSVYGRGFSTP